MTAGNASGINDGAAAMVVILGVVLVRTQTSSEQLRKAVDQLGDFDHAVRVEASRFVRRASSELAGPVLRDAIRRHQDSYVQFRALVLLYGFGSEDARDAFNEALDSENDRLRAAAYDYFEHAPDPLMAQALLGALDLETSEFVRPALVRALAAHDDSDEAVRSRLVRDIDQGEDFFRGAVIEALGDHGAVYAVDSLVEIARERGPLQDDALLALGKISDPRVMDAMEALQGSASDTLQPVVSATACLLGIDCAEHVAYVVDVLRYGAQVAKNGNQALLRGAAAGLSALAMRGDRVALDALFEVGITSIHPSRAPIALALGTVALRSPEEVRAALVRRATIHEDLLLLRDAFDMLDEDLAEERFYALIRRAYWEAAEGSATRESAEVAIQVLEF